MHNEMNRLLSSDTIHNSDGYEIILFHHDGTYNKLVDISCSFSHAVSQFRVCSGHTLAKANSNHFQTCQMYI